MTVLDPGHEVTKIRVGMLAKVVLAVGALVLVFGLVEHASIFFRPSSEFFADPTRVMDENSRRGFVGVVCFGLGGTLMALGVSGLFFAYAGRLLRFTSAETTPVAKDVFNDVAKGTTEGVTAIARAVKKGLEAEVVKVRCRACRHLEAEDAAACSKCGAVMA